ncbi:hypothetical protein HELRODRAFT_68894, partial [Helobdella robusta]|uniref:Retinoid-inducible serine carboxypeptidase n=1 Tax=Helobdella robusta TaxID=6412 RepID=T1FZK8_HELRO
GGPGGSSCGYGNFDIIGPLDSNLKERNTSWIYEANLLFVDNPVGAGYSYVDNKTLFTTDVAQISKDLLTLLKSFLQSNPEYKNIRFYIFGQSYGGKMGAHFSKVLYEEIQAKKIECNLVGYAMGNSWISPIDSTLTWGPFIYWMSTTDENGLENIQKPAKQCQKAVDEGRWKAATELWRITEIAVMKNTNNVDFYNILNFNVPTSISKLHSDFGILFRKDGETLESDNLDSLMNGPIKKKLGIIPAHVKWGAQSGDVFKYQEGDFMRPVVQIVDETLMNTTLEVVVYQGQLDIICDTKAAMDWVQQFKWSGLSLYNKSERKAFVEPLTGQTEFFVKAYEKFKFYWILRGGHSVCLFSYFLITKMKKLN